MQTNKKINQESREFRYVYILRGRALYAYVFKKM